MAWYRCDVDNQYDGAAVYRRGEYYNLSGTPPAAFFTADSTYASTLRTFVAPGVSVDQDGKVYVDGNLEATGGTITKAGTAVISQAEADTVSTAELAASDAVSTAEAAADTAIRDGIQAQSNVAVSLLTSDTTAAKQAKIDAVARTALPGVTATFTFEDGTHTETDTLTFDGFTYPIIIQGNSSDASSLSTAQSVTIDTSSSEVNTLSITNCANVTVSKLKIAFKTDTQKNDAINAFKSNIDIEYCYLLGNGKSFGYGVDVGCSLSSWVANYVSNMQIGLVSRSSLCYSNGNDDTGTAPAWGIYGLDAGRIGKRGTQPAGTTANELTGGGGVIS